MSLAATAEKASLLPEVFSRWFASRGWAPRAHQLELLARARDGKSVLLIAPTGGGKTLAGFLPTLVELSERAQQRWSAPSPREAVGRVGVGGEACRTATAQTHDPPPPTPPHHSLREWEEGSGESERAC